MSRTRTDTLQGRYYLETIPPATTVNYSGIAQVVERISAHGAAGATLTVTVPGAPGPVIVTLAANQNIHVLEPLGRYDLQSPFTVTTSLGAECEVELVDLT